MNRPDLVALLGRRVTVTAPGPAWERTLTGKLVAITDQPTMVVEADDGQRRDFLQYRCKVVLAVDTPPEPAQPVDPESIPDWESPFPGPVVDAATAVLAQLDRMLANLQAHIDQRAAELAQPLIDETRDAALADIKAARDGQQRSEDLVAEMRRQLAGLERQATRDRERVARVRALHSREVHPGGTSYCLECCDGVITPWPCDTIRALDGQDADRG